MKQIIEMLKTWGADINGAMGRFLDDEDFYVDCLHRFMSDANVSMLKKAVDASDRGNIFEASHSLKGTTGTLGLVPLYDKVSILVEDSRSELKDTVKQDYEAFDSVYQEFVKMVRSAA